MNSEQLLILFQEANIPDYWQLCCVKENKRPSHPDQQFLSHGNLDQTTYRWTEPLDKERFFSNLAVVGFDHLPSSSLIRREILVSPSLFFWYCSFTLY